MDSDELQSYLRRDRLELLIERDNPNAWIAATLLQELGKGEPDTQASVALSESRFSAESSS